MGFPNVATVIGSHATENWSQGCAAWPANWRPYHKLFLTTTHFHPEHAAGEPGFPTSTIYLDPQGGATAGNGEARAGDVDMFSQPHLPPSPC
jgi:hypothetical protein